MRSIYLCGHGNWDPNDGFIFMPKGCSMIFYTHHAKTMYQDAVLQIVSGNYGGEPHQVVSQYMSVPNMRLSPDSIANEHSTYDHLLHNPAPQKNAWFVNEQVTLKTLFDSYAGRIQKYAFQDDGVMFHWTCCRYVDMPKMTYRLTPGGRVLAATPGRGRVRGREGFNATEDLLRDIFIYRDRTDNNRVIRQVPR